MKKRFLALALALVMAFSLMGTALAAPADGIAALAEDDLTGSVIILHTNDVHGAIASYAQVAGMKEEYESRGAEVILVDAGDFIQGATSVSTSQGATAVELMNMAGYDLATVGNHEFDYGFARLQELEGEADFPILAANVLYNGESAFESSYVYTTKSGLKIGFFGLVTPETATKAHPAKIEGVTFLSGEELYACAQEQVDALEAEGCDVIVCLGHLGIDEESAPNRSTDLLQNVTGIDLFIDGHSHSTLEDIAAVTDGTYMVGDTILTSTGTQLENIGLALIAGGEIATMSVITSAVTVSDEAVAARAAEILAEIEEQYGAVFATTEVTLNGERDPGNRTEETNLGDLICDAILWYANTQGVETDAAHTVALTNGGGIRATIEAGDITRNDVNAVLPFGNTVGVVYVTGAELLEALEASTYCTPTAVGGFPQVSGITFSVDTSVPYDQGELYPGSTYYGPASIQRVTIESINGQPFDENATYGVVTNDFVAAGGDTYYAFKAAGTYIDTGVALDEVLMDFITEELGGVITAEAYGEPKGQITIIEPIFVDVTEDDWYYDEVMAAYEAGLVLGTGENTFSPNANITREDFVTLLYRLAGSPEVPDSSVSFTDVEADAYYAAPIAWAVGEGIVVGYSDDTFGVGVSINREEMAAFLYRYSGFAFPEGKGYLLSYADTADISTWATEAVAFCTMTGLMQGIEDNRFDPQGTANRAQAAAVVVRLSELDLDNIDVSGCVDVYAVTAVSQYGNITLDIAKEDFLALGYEYGDIVTLTLSNGTTMDVPFVSNYSDVDNGQAALLARESDDYVTAAINMGDFATTYGVEVGSFLTVTMKEAGGYLDEYLIRQLERTNNREDYESDAVFANFRAVELGSIAAGTLYRSSSPVNNEIGRAAYADDLAAAAGIATVINLADTAEAVEAYMAEEGFDSPYYQGLYESGAVVTLGMGVDFSSADFQAKLKTGLEFLAAHEGPYLIHCNEGKDRAGFVVALLECLMGASQEEIVADYMLSYVNYYHVEVGSAQYTAIANSNIIQTLCAIAGVEDAAGLAGVDLAAAAENYLTGIGLSAETIDAIQANLSGAASLAVAA